MTPTLDLFLNSLLGGVVAAAVLIVGYLAKERLGLRSAQLTAVQDAANAALIAAQRAAAERRIEAAMCLWREVLRIRTVTLIVLGKLDLAGPSGYRKLLDEGLMTESDCQTAVNEVLENPDIEEVRPLVGEVLFARFFVYRAVLGSICHFLFESASTRHTAPWTEAENIRRLLRVALTESEFEEFLRLADGHVDWTRSRLQKPILADLGELIAGGHSKDEGLSKAQEILEAVQATELGKSGNVDGSG